MAAPARDESLQDETYLPREDTAEIIDFLSALRVRGRETADPRPRLTGPDGRSVELPEPRRDDLLAPIAADLFQRRAVRKHPRAAAEASILHQTINRFGIIAHDARPFFSGASGALSEGVRGAASSFSRSASPNSAKDNRGRSGRAGS